MTVKPRVIRIRTLKELDDLEEHWRTLEQIEGGPSIFQSWEWNRTWCDYVLPNRKRASLDVRVVEDSNGKILAILPFFEEAPAGPFIRITQFLGHRMSYHNDVLLADPASSELADEVIQALMNDLGPRSVLHLRHLNGDSMFTKQLLVRHNAEPQCTRLWCRVDPTITDQRVRLGRSTRKNLRSCENQLRRQYKVEFCIRSGQEFHEAFDELINLHVNRFDSKRGSTLLVRPALKFLRVVTEKLNAMGHCEIIQLKADGLTIASQLMVHDKNRYFFVQSGFDQKFYKFSPMRLLITESLRRGFDDLACEIFDFGPGYEGYKYYWSPLVGTNYMCCCGGNGLYAKGISGIYQMAFRYHVHSISKGVGKDER